MDGPVSSSPRITSTPGGQRLHSAAIALGSNLGDKFYNIELALRLLETPEATLEEGVPVGAMVAVVDTSFLYESAPMYVTDQPAFINCACIIETNLTPIILLKLLKGIEGTVGRVPSIRNGPRAVDLDIVLYDREVLDTRSHENRTDLENLDGELIIPHPRMSEREFVLRPLDDMIPDYIHPILAKPIHDLFTAVSQQDTPLRKVIPFPKYPLPAPTPSHRVAPTLTYWSHPPFSTDDRAQQPRRTRLMATLNTTPDSFSDGATHNTPATALAYACAAVNSGASIIDVGGYSTRPGAAFVSVEEELARVIPVIEAVRGSGDTPISVDTFRHEVAGAAVLAGANCINDVYAFAGPGYPNVDLAAMDGMKRVARDLGVPVVLMHSRGDAGKIRITATLF
ncbi:Dihydropteroate synthase-like protein [Infundibulicybe gibba]|nr:Dihydropteroate synthase-like protein [Infundibulicybe gibba]